VAYESFAKKYHGTEAVIRTALDLSVRAVELSGLKLAGGVSRSQEVLVKQLFYITVWMN
jgi:hypothetical protein